MMPKQEIFKEITQPIRPLKIKASTYRVNPLVSAETNPKLNVKF